jgi:hypothetical protein
MDRAYFLYADGQQTGPFTLAQVRERKITRATMVWYEGLSGWVGAEQVDELKDLFGGSSSTAAPPPSVSIDGSVVPGYASNQQLAEQLSRHHRLMIVFLLSWIGFAVIFVIILVFTVAMQSEESIAGVGIIGGALLLALIILQIVHFCKFHYRCWEVAIARTGERDTSPDMAVGLLFVPLFNLYWNFRSYHRLTQLLERAYNERGLPPVDAPAPGTTMALCILNVCSVVPFLGGLAALVAFVLWFIVLGAHKRACLALLSLPR